MDEQDDEIETESGEKSDIPKTSAEEQKEAARQFEILKSSITHTS